jgi:hypothetical protein
VWVECDALGATGGCSAAQSVSVSGKGGPSESIGKTFNLTMCYLTPAMHLGSTGKSFTTIRTTFSRWLWVQPTNMVRENLSHTRGDITSCVFTPSNRTAVVDRIADHYSEELDAAFAAARRAIKQALTPTWADP